MEAHLCVRNNSYLIFARNFKKMNRNPVPVLKKEPERRSGAFRSNSNPAYFINWPITVRSVVPFRSVPEIITAQSRVIIAAAARTAVTI